MTLSTAPLMIIVACFAIAALVHTSMSGGSVSTGLKGSARKLQFNPGPSGRSIFAAVPSPAGYGTGLINDIRLKNALTSNSGYNTGLINNIKLQNALTSNVGYNTGLINNIKLQNALTSNTGYNTGITNVIKLQNALGGSQGIIFSP